MTEQEVIFCEHCDGTGKDPRTKNGVEPNFPCRECFMTGRDCSRWPTQAEKDRVILAILVRQHVPSGALPGGIFPYDLDRYQREAEEVFPQEFIDQLKWTEGAERKRKQEVADWMKEQVKILEARK